ncbi:MAG: hypothetical protein HZA20_11980 [Nitrospirae bacterium]|nr:hypothetical protein [Nitrospirota bacterium]
MKLMKLILVVFVVVSLASCATGVRLYPKSPDSNSVAEGVYDVILYGMDGPNDVETVAILDRTDDSYRLVSKFGSEHYKVYYGLKADQAVEKASNFLKGLTIVTAMERRMITGPNGERIGYEIRPIFDSSTVINSYFGCSYNLQPNSDVVFSVMWQEFYKPFSSLNKR